MEKPPITFKKSKWKSLLLFLLSLILVPGGFLMLEDEPLIGILGIALFGLGGIAALTQLLPNAYYLKLDEEGFEVKHLFRTSFTSWSEIKNLRASSVKGNKMILFDYTAKHTKGKAGKKLAKFLGGNEGGLISDYNIKTKELLELMKDYKRSRRKTGSNPAKDSGSIKER